MEKVIKLLEDHNIETKVCDGRVWAKCVYMYLGQSELEWTDVTEWSHARAREWLGY